MTGDSFLCPLCGARPGHPHLTITVANAAGRIFDEPCPLAGRQPAILTAPEATVILGMTDTRDVAALILAGELPAVKSRGRWLIARDDVVAYLARKYAR